MGPSLCLFFFLLAQNARQRGNGLVQLFSYTDEEPGAWRRQDLSELSRNYALGKLGWVRAGCPGSLP